MQHNELTKVFASVKRKFAALPDPVGFSISLTPASFSKVLALFAPTPESVLLEVGCGKGFLIVYSALVGFKSVIGWDIEPLSVLRSKHTYQQCAVDPRFSAELKHVQFAVYEEDGLRCSIPHEVTHVTIIIAWSNEQLRVILDRLQQAPALQMFALLLGRQAQAQLDMIATHFNIVQVISVALEGSGEKRQVVVARV